VFVPLPLTVPLLFYHLGFFDRVWLHAPVLG
jgi:hypothetical protein